MSTAVEYRPAGSLAKLLFKNAFLNIVTLSIYRFWARTALRRHFWQAIRLDGDPFEYTGLGRELFIGFLIVVAVLAPLTLAWSGLETMLEGEQIASGLAKVAYFLLFYILIQIARFRARRYRLSRTRWRGIRAGQDGSTSRYVVLSLIWGIVSVLTLGIGFPWMRTALQRYRTTNTRFGEQYFAFDAPVLPLLSRWLVVLATIILPYAGAALLWWQVFSPAITDQGVDEAILRQQFEAGMLSLGGSFGLIFVAALCGGLSYVWYRVAEFRHFTAHTRLGQIAFASAARASTVLGRLLLFAVYLLLFFFVVGIVSTLVGATIAVLAARGVIESGGLIGVAGSIIGFVGGLIAYQMLWTYIVTAGTLRHVCETLSISNPEQLAQIAQTTEPEPKFGEGLADSFEVAG